MNLHNQNRVYTEVIFEWCELTNQYIEVSSTSEEYNGEWALCAAVTNKTDTDVGVGYAAGVTTAAAIVQFNKANVTFPLITTAYAVKGSTSVSFPEWSKLALTTVTNNVAGSEGDTQNATALTSVANTVEVLRNNVHANVTDLVVHGATEAAVTQAGQVLGNTVAAEFDNNVCALFDAFATTKGTSSDGLKFLDVMDAVASLEANDAPRPYSAVLHPLQMWGTYGLSNELGITAVQGSNGAFNGNNLAADQFFGTGFVTTLAGVNFYTSPQVPDGSDATEKKGAIFAKTALGAALINAGGGSFIEVRQEREETSASTVIVANGYWALSELVDLHGVEIFTEISG